MNGPLPDNILKRMDPTDRAALGKAGVTTDEALAAAEAKHERELQKQLAQLLDLRDIVFATPRMDKRSTLKVGWPDFTFVIGGKPCAWEAKIRDNKLTSEQQELHTKMRLNGWTVQVIRNVNEAIEFLNHYGAKP